MKKLVLIGLVMVSTAAGCGRGWLPFRGAPCNSNCVHATPAYDRCPDCNSGQARYEDYEGGQYGGGIVSEQPYYGGPAVPGTNIAPPMTPMTGIPRAGS